MSSCIVRENAVSSSCILVPEVPVACRVGGRQGEWQWAWWWPGGLPLPSPPLPWAPSGRTGNSGDPIGGTLGQGAPGGVPVGAAPMPSKARCLPGC